MKPHGQTIYQLSAQTGAERLTIRKLFSHEGIKPCGKNKRGNPLYDDKALARVKEYLKEAHSRKAGEVGPDGMTPRQRLDTAKAEAQEMANEKERKTISGEWIAASTHHAIIKTLVDGIDNFIGKVISQYGLSAAQSAGLQREADAWREDAAKRVEKM